MTSTTDFYGGIDIGSSTAKLVIIDAARTIIAKAMRRSGINYQQTADRLLDEVCATSTSLQPGRIVFTMSTGYGRENVSWAQAKMTEIACHGKGAYHHFQKKMTVIDIGAQDSKIIHLDDAGKRVGFKMNRKCAAGTGSFIEEVSHRLAIDISELNGLAQLSTSEVPLSSFCTVFAATEVIDKIRAGFPVEDIVRGAFNSVARRIAEMDSIDGILVATGGVVANNPFLVTLLGKTFGVQAQQPPDAQFTGAFGAALFALEQAKGAAKPM
jgi:(R)-2-hydroxyacyl-CoA dehydratese activating ATPase